MSEREKGKRGFGGMDPAKVRAIARLGGLASAAKGTGHRFTTETGRAAGRKGGTAPHTYRGRNPVAEKQLPLEGVS